MVIRFRELKQKLTVRWLWEHSYRCRDAGLNGKPLQQGLRRGLQTIRFQNFCRQIVSKNLHRLQALGPEQLPSSRSLRHETIGTHPSFPVASFTELSATGQV